MTDLGANDMWPLISRYYKALRAVVVSALFIDVYLTGAIAGFILAAKN